MTPPLDLPGAVRAGIQGFERDCDRHFLAGRTIENVETGEETRRFDPATNPARYTSLLEFGPYGDLTALSSVVWAPESSPAETLALNTDFWPVPVNAPATGFPYTGLEFRRRFWAPLLPANRHSIEVTGLWGFGTILPADAWRAMLTGAAVQAWTGIFNARSGGVLSWKEADVSEDYGIQPLSDIRKGWAMDYDRAVTAYRRVQL